MHIMKSVIVCVLVTVIGASAALAPSTSVQNTTAIGTGMKIPNSLSFFLPRDSFLISLNTIFAHLSE